MQIGGHEIERELGRGAMGVVYLARDLQLARQVAIKTIQVDRGMAEEHRQAMRVRFFREARAAAGLVHPNIITIHQIGEDSGQPYIVMEYIDGISMDQAIRPGSGWSVRLLLDGLRQVAGALDYAHSRGLVHRDVKPANILIGPMAGFKVADFGIVKILDEEAMTQTGATMGTPSYTSPEQLRGETVSGRSDQFALAVMAYRVLTGRMPFEAASLATLFFQIAQEEPEDVSRLNPALGPQVDFTIRKAMAKAPEQRFASCVEFIDVLRAALNASTGVAGETRLEPQPQKTEPSKTGPPVPPRISEEGFRDPKWAVAFFALLAVSGAGLMWWKQQGPPAPVVDGHYTEIKPVTPHDGESEHGKRDVIRKSDPPPVPVEREQKPEKETFPVKFEAVPPVTGPRDGLPYRWIPAGKFSMGCSPGELCPSNEFRHAVTISKGFWLASTETTVGAYKKFVKAKGLTMPDTAVGREEWNDDAMPVSNVAHPDAAAFCAWAGGRLPTEAEWEYAARAGTTGNTYGRVSQIAWTYAEELTVYLKLHEGKYPPVGLKEPNRFGLYDMIGNVSEWVADFYKEDYYKYSPDVDPPGPEQGSAYVHRGCSILTIPYEVRVSHRGQATDSRYTSPEIGFRCVGAMNAR